MTEKDDILKMDREENKGADLPELEASSKDSYAAVIVAALIALVVVVVEMAVEKRPNFSVMIIIASLNATIWTRKALRSKDKVQIGGAAAWAVATLCWIVLWIIGMIG